MSGIISQKFKETDGYQTKQLEGIENIENSAVDSSTIYNLQNKNIFSDNNSFLFELLSKNLSIADYGVVGRNDHPIVKDPMMHTMENSLYMYLSIKMHNDIIEKLYKRIIVVGNHDRSGGIATNEKGGKEFNWQRPTSKLIGDDLFIKCPVGHEYVQHYASLIGTYLYLTGQDSSRVSYVPPTEKECWDFIESSNLSQLNPSDFVIYGFGLPQTTNIKHWKGGGPFRWANKRIGKTDITFLGCDYCVWGDIAGRMLRYLAEIKRIKKFIYIGKVGSINPSFPPNRHLASGNKSFIHGNWVEWDSIFSDTPEDDVLKKGIHYTLPSTLMETKEWLNKVEGFDFVDPEIGHMGSAASRAGIKYGYMHIISDNLANKFSEDLSNERIKNVIDKRKFLLSKIRNIIQSIC